MRHLVPLAAVLSMSLSLSSAAPALADPVSAAWTPASIPWQAAAPNGTKYALLEGRREPLGGVFTYAFFIPAGVWDSPHRHATTARVFVVKGELRLGYGTSADKAHAARYGQGSLVVVPGGADHFVGAEVDTIIIGVATGPWSTAYLDGSKPASAGTPILKSDGPK